MWNRSWNFDSRVGSWQKQYPPASEDYMYQWYISPAKLPSLTIPAAFKHALYSTYGFVLGVLMPADQGRQVSHQMANSTCIWFQKIQTQLWTICYMKTSIIKCCRAVKPALLLQNPAMDSALDHGYNLFIIWLASVRESCHLPLTSSDY